MAYSPQNPRFCHSCHRALKACLCSEIHPLVGPIPISFLVHPNEIQRTQSTGWLAHRMLQNSRFYQENDFQLHNDESSAILFPSPESVPWNSISFSHLIIPDGTWDECKQMMKRQPRFSKMPRIQLTGCYQGEFMGRRAPWQGALSTIEAIGYLFEEMGSSVGTELRRILQILNEREMMFRSKSTQP